MISIIVELHKLHAVHYSLSDTSTVHGYTIKRLLQAVECCIGWVPIWSKFRCYSVLFEGG